MARLARLGHHEAVPYRGRRTVAWLVALAALLTGLVAAAPARAAAPPSGLTLTTTRSAVAYGTSVLLTARLTSGSAPVAGQTVLFLHHPAGAAATTEVGRAVTDVDGTARLRVVPTASTSYRARRLATDGAVTDSAVTRVTVRALVRTRWSRSALPLGRRLGVTGTVTPAAAGTPVWVERYLGGRWRVVARTTTTSTGAYTVGVPTRTTRGFSSYRVLVPVQATVAAGAGRTLRLDSYSLHTYVVRTKGTVVVPVTDFAAAAAATYADARGWPAAHHRFARVRTGGAFTLVISEARYLPSFSSVCSTRYSCRVGRYVVVNQDRWRLGSAPFTGSRTAYRHMVLNHETGHWLGLGHASCPRRDALAPVMLQQSKSLQGCRPNAWPLAGELRAVA